MRGFTVSVIITAFVLAYAAPRTGGAMMAADVKKELRTAMFHASVLAHGRLAIGGRDPGGHRPMIGGYHRPRCRPSTCRAFD